ncbi:MAG: S8 family serine peptidase [Limisphaerales bacterium]
MHLKHGLLSVLMIAAGSLDAVAADASNSLDATAVFDRHFAAVGGRAALEQAQSVVVKGAGQENDRSFNFEISVNAPGLILMVASNATGIVVRQGRSDRAQCWRQDPEGVRDLDATDAGDLMNVAVGFLPPALVHWSEMLAHAVCQEDRDGDRDVIAIGRKSDDAAFPRLLFDKRSGLLVRVGNIRLDDYRQVQGIKLPFRVLPGTRSSLEVREISLNPTLNRALFAKPETNTHQPVEQLPPAEYHTMLSAAGKLEIVRHPPPANFGRGKLSALPHYDPKAMRPFQVDLRGFDLRSLNLSDRAADLLRADFDAQTIWPSPSPAPFDRDRILELGKDPGLRVRELHRQGVTGKGVGIGIIDQTLLVDHAEYRDRVKLYEEIHAPAGAPAQMHGPAVASIAAGKTVGVAPEADLYYIAETHGTFGRGGTFDWDFTWLAKSIERLLDVNATLPADRKIRVISISVGWAPEQKGYAETTAAVERAKRDGVFIVSTAIESTHKLAFHGLGRDALLSPTDANSYGPGSWWARYFWDGVRRFTPGERLLVPMDSRGVASPTGSDDYVFYSSGGWSWSVPWISGLYALGCQVRPDLTPELFWAEASKSGQTIHIRHADEDVAFGTIANPVALIESLRRGR